MTINPPRLDVLTCEELVGREMLTLDILSLSMVDDISKLEYIREGTMTLKHAPFLTFAYVDAVS